MLTIPKLFILYVNDIATQLNLDSIPLIFANDTTLLAFGEDTNQTVTQLNNYLSKIAKWAKVWKLKFNGTKSKDVIFTPNKHSRKKAGSRDPGSCDFFGQNSEK